MKDSQKVKIPYKPGQNRNEKGTIVSPNGPRPALQPQSAPEAQLAAQKLAPEALEKLRLIMRATKSPASAKVAAANAILDRAYGKPAQAVELADKGAGALNSALAQRVGRLSDEQLATEIVKAERRAQLVALKAGVTGRLDDDGLEH